MSDGIDRSNQLRLPDRQINLTENLKHWTND